MCFAPGGGFPGGEQPLPQGGPKTVGGGDVWLVLPPMVGWPSYQTLAISRFRPSFTLKNRA